MALRDAPSRARKDRAPEDETGPTGPKSRAEGAL